MQLRIAPLSIRTQGLGEVPRRPANAGGEQLLRGSARIVATAAAAVTWSDVVEDELEFVNTKNGHARRVQITARMRQLLDRLPHSTRSEYVFVNPRTGRRLAYVRKIFSRAVKRAGMGPDVTPHVLRHTAITRMLMAGIDDYTVMETVGHLTKKMLERYAHPSTERRRAALDSFERLLIGGSQDVRVKAEATA